MKELLAPIVELLAYAAVAVVLTAAGLFAEITSVQYIAAGNVVFATWLAVMGAIALYAGVVAVGVQEVVPRFKAAVDEAR